MGVNGSNDFSLLIEYDADGNIEEIFELSFKEAFILVSMSLTDNPEYKDILLDYLTDILEQAILDE